MDLLDAEEFQDDSEMSLKGGKVDQDSLKLNSRGFDSKHCVESAVDKQYEGKHHRTRPDKYSDNHSSDRRKFSEKPGRHKERRQSRSTEDKHIHHRSRERSTRRKHKRSRSRSREKSSQSSQECDSNLGEKTKMWKENESSTTEPLRRENEMSGFILNDDQVELDHGKINRKDTGGHSCFREGSISKVRSRVKSPSTEVEAHRTRSPSVRHSFDDCHTDQVQNKRHKFNSPDLGKNSVSKDCYLNSDQRYRKRRSRSRSGSHSRHKRQYRSSHRRERSRSNSRDNSRSQHRERSGSQTGESKFAVSQRRQKSRTRSRERRIREDGRTSNSEDGQKKIYEEDEWSRKYPQSKSEFRHEYRNYDVRSGERKQARERELDVSNAEVRSSDSERMKRRRSKSAERNWSSYTDRTFNHKFNNVRGNRGNRWISGSRDEGGKMYRAFHETYKGNFRQNRWRSDIEDSGHNGRDPKARGQTQTQDWLDRRQQHEDQGQETHSDDGQHLEDMVVKSLAKLRQDSDSVKDSNVVTSDQENRSLSSQNRREDDQSTIPVLLTKKSVYVKSDVSKSCDQTLQLENSNCQRDRTERSSNESTLKGHLYSSRDRPVRHPRAGHPCFQGEFRPSAQLPRFEFQRGGRPLMPLSRGMIPPPVGVRLPPGFAQPRVIVSPFHMHPPAMRDVSRPPVNWHIVGPMSAHPSPPVGPGRPLIQVGGFIRTQVPVEFLAGPPLMPAPGQFSHPPPFQPRLPPLPPHSLPAVNNQGVPLQPLPVRTGDPIRMQQPIALMHPHHIRMPSHDPRPGVVDVSNLASLHAIVSSHYPPTTVNLGIPPPILPMRIAGPAEAPPRYDFSASSQGNDPNTSNSSPTPPPPPPPPAAVSMLDPRLNPMKPFSQQRLNFAPCHSSSSTSDESVKSDLLDEHGSPRSTMEHADENMMETRSPEQHVRTSESPHSASSVGSGCSPPHTIEDAYAEALFEEPYNRPTEESDAQIVLHIPPENSSHKPNNLLHVPENSPMLSDTSHKFVSTKIQDNIEATSTALNNAEYKHLNRDEEQALIPEIVNPMESPDGGQVMKESSLFGSTNPLNVSTRTLDLIQVADLQKVLETVRTSVLSNEEEEEEEEEAKSQDKRLFMPDRMDQIAEEVKLALKPHFGKGLIDKDEYKDIMRKTVPKIFNSKSSLDRARIQTFVQEYVNRIVKSRKAEKAKKPSSQSHKPPKHYARIS